MLFRSVKTRTNNIIILGNKLTVPNSKKGGDVIIAVFCQIRIILINIITFLLIFCMQCKHDKILTIFHVILCFININ